MGDKRTRKKEKNDKKVLTPTESWKIPDKLAAAKEIFHTQVPSPSTFETQIGKTCTVITQSQLSTLKLARLHLL